MEIDYNKSRFSHFWHEVPRNPLGKSYHVQPHHLRKIRILCMIPCLITALLTFFGCLAAGVLIQAMMYLTIWGVFACAIYFVGVLLVHDHEDGIAWKFVYVIGEMAACMEFVICPFFWIVLFPLFYDDMDAGGIFINFIIHFLIPVTIWIDILLNHIRFPNSHKYFLAALTFIYGVLNYVWTKVEGEPIYPPLIGSVWKVGCFVPLRFL
jgi:hypothetical protein